MTDYEVKTRAIMFSDIESFSAMMDRDEQLAMALVVEHNELLGARIRAHRGELVKLMGDGALACFESASDAVGCAIDIQRTLAARNEDCPPERRIVLRIGIHIGDVILKDSDAFGHGVNVAARVEPLAEPGGICITQTVYDMVRSRPGFTTVSLGPRELKNIADSVHIYRVLVDAQAAADAEVARALPPRPVWPRRALAAAALVAALGLWWAWAGFDAAPSVPVGSMSDGSMSDGLPSPGRAGWAGASSAEAPAAPATPADPCTCLEWADISFSLVEDRSDPKAGRTCRGGVQCAEEFELVENWCADPLKDGYPWCYVSAECPGAVRTSDGMRFWRRCSDVESHCECLNWTDVSFSLSTPSGGCGNAMGCVEAFDLVGNTCADPGGVRGFDWCFTYGACPSAVKQGYGEWTKRCFDVPAD